MAKNTLYQKGTKKSNAVSSDDENKLAAFVFRFFPAYARRMRLIDL